MWADGSACKGSTADSSFQSHGGNCFKDIEFVPNCRDKHGPGSRVGTVSSHVDEQPLCECAAGFEVASTTDGSWQCNVKSANGSGPSGTERVVPVWALVFCSGCLLITVISVVSAVRAKRELAAKTGGSARMLQHDLVSQW
eukprot:COSAG02_NODE_541_length_20598_cov_278.953754_12_plen_141_part_00